MKKITGFTYNGDIGYNHLTHENGEQTLMLHDTVTRRMAWCSGIENVDVEIINRDLVDEFVDCAKRHVGNYVATTV
jgi:hypothetical protein